MEDNEVLKKTEEIELTDGIVFADPPDESLENVKTLEPAQDIEEIKTNEEDIVEEINDSKEECVLEDTSEAISEVETSNNVEEEESIVEETEPVIEKLVIPQSTNNEKIEMIRQMNNSEEIEEPTITISNTSKETIFTHSSLCNSGALEVVEGVGDISRRRKLALRVGNVKGNK